jgi:hypothetical protein
MRYVIAVAAALAALATPAAAAETVASLLAQEYTVVGGIQSNIGVGIFLQKKEKLFLCFASETPTSPTIATRYCKPVQ